MQISERDQVIIRLGYRAKFGFLPHTEVSFKLLKAKRFAY